MNRVRATLLAIAALLVATALPATAGAAVERIDSAKVVTTPPPQLLLFHGGAFLDVDPEFELATAQWAINFGFVPHFATYPLGDLNAAVESARAEARAYVKQYGAGHVYVYGASAGGTLASLLADDGLVAGAVAKAPVSDLVSWEWPLGVYGPDYFERIRADLPTRERLSPLYRAGDRPNPLLVIQGRLDRVVPASMNEAFAASHENVELRLVPGGHSAERRDPEVLGEAIRWLSLVARERIWKREGLVR